MAKGFAMTPTTSVPLRVAAIAAAALSLAACEPGGRAADYARAGDVVPTRSYATERQRDAYLDIQEFRPAGDPRYLCVHVYRTQGGSLSCFLSER
jgi:hypothetical protein